ncbi:MAG: hypothetical protein U5L96_16020 [Owenweeksia sp.]|nr:hypothetical protein [Owenweeksia sp.]
MTFSEVLVNTNPKQWPGNWAKQYEDFTDDVSKLKERLRDDRAVTDKELYKNLKTVNDYPSFLRKLLYDKANGISSRGQSTLAEKKLNELQGDEKFEEIIKRLILDPSTDNYTEFRSVWKSKVEKDNKVLINRAFAASRPEQLTSTVDEPKFFKVLAFLKVHCDYEPEGKGNWYEANVQVTHMAG